MLAAAMTAAALALVAWPLFRGRGTARGWPVALLVLALALPVGAGLLYRSVSNWSWDPAALAAAAAGRQSVEQMVAKLEARLKANPNDLDGWLMLGRSRFVMTNYPGAADAFASAYKLADGKSIEAVIGYGEALAMVDPGTLKGRAGALFEEALKLEPDNSKALFYGGAAAVANGHLELARERWARLVHQPLPDAVRVAVAVRIGELDDQLGRPKDAEIAKLAAAGAGPAAAGVSPAAGPAAPPDAAAGPSGPGAATVRVSLSPALAGKIPAGAQLFVLARDATQPGPPFAAKRLGSATLPLTVVLSTEDAMIPGRTIRDAKQLVIVARYSASGRPIAASGDYYGEVPYDLAAGKPAELVIDKQVP